MSQSGGITLNGHYDENGLFVTNSQYAKFPLRCRPNSSDPLVFAQIFLSREYACLDDVPDASLIIDCGANVGYSSAYFLSRFPQASTIAIEPDSANFQILTLNLAPYGTRAKAIQSGVWSRKTWLKISNDKYRDGREWSRQVQECTANEGGFMATDIGTVLAESGHERISILKVDIEGAEAIVFSENYESWLDRVENLVIELHDDSFFGPASGVFMGAISGRGFSVARYGELTVCKKGLRQTRPPM